MDEERCEQMQCEYYVYIGHGLYGCVYLGDEGCIYNPPIDATDDMDW